MGEQEIGMRCIKYMLLSVTAMFVVTSALIISVGTTIFSFYHDFSYFLEPHVFSPATLVIFVGGCMLFVSLFGLIGAARESTCLVNIFALVLGLVLVLELAAAGLACRLRHRAGAMLDDSLRGALQLYAQEPEVRDALDFLQYNLNCCGVDSYTDWGALDHQLDNHGISVSNLTVPYSCCALSDHASVGGVACVQLYASGCLPRLASLVTSSAALLGTGALTIALIQAIGIMFSLMLARSIRRAKSERERRRWEIRETLLNPYTPLKSK